MKKYFIYFWFVTRHRWYVMLECWKEALYWQGVIHDLSKFYPSEFLPHGRYHESRLKDILGGKITYHEWMRHAPKEFLAAQNNHLNRNKHHLEYWLMLDADGDLAALEMPEKYALEMICDWRGVARSFRRHANESVTWYYEHKKHIPLHPKTEAFVESILNNSLQTEGGQDENKESG